MSHSITSASVIVIRAIEPISPSGTISEKSVWLEFAPGLGFMASILCSPNEKKSAQLEGRCDLEKLRAKLMQMREAEREQQFHRSYAVEVMRNQDGSFKVILSNKPRQANQRFQTTLELAEALKESDLHDPDYGRLQKMAIAVIGCFAQEPVKTPALIEEVSALAIAQNTLVTQSLLKILITEINQSILLDPNLLKALKETLINSYIEALDADDLIQVLKVIMDRINKMHKQEGVSPKFFVIIATLSDLLDVMGDANVINVDRINLHDPLYTVLDGLSKDDDLLIAAQAAYAKQSLVRIPNDETKLSSFIRHGTAAAQGFASLYQVVSNHDLPSLLSAYQSFSDAANFQERKQKWHDDLRMLKILSAKDHFAAFSSIVYKSLKETTNSNVVGNILFILHELVLNHSDFNAKKWALNMMSDLFLNDKLWGDAKKVKKQIKDKILDCLKIPDRLLEAEVRSLLTMMGKNASTDQQNRLMQDALEDARSITPKLEREIKEVSTDLINRAQESQTSSLADKFRQLREKALFDAEVTKELAYYIPTQCSRSLFNPTENLISLDENVDQFLKGGQPVMLLAGSSGGGKTIYFRFLERRLWKNWDPTKPIPIFISLPSLKTPFQEAISEALKSRGFSNKDQTELKTHYRFLFLLDSYDELKQDSNIYSNNQFSEWQCQVLVNCRTQYLVGERSNYQNFFLPLQDNPLLSSSLEECAISPFSSTQIEAYIRNFLLLQKSSYTWEQYQAIIASIPDLRDIIETPFLLCIVAKFLPTIVSRHHSKNCQAQIKLQRIDIFDEFVNNWFNKEENRLRRPQSNSQELLKKIKGIDLKKLFTRMAVSLATEMRAEGIVAITIDETTEQKWFNYFGPNPLIELIRSGLPLVQIGPNTFAFIHKSILEYFSARAIVPKDFLHPLPPEEYEVKKIEFDEMKSYAPRQDSSSLSHSLPPYLPPLDSLTVQKLSISASTSIAAPPSIHVSITPPPVPRKPSLSHTPSLSEASLEEISISVERLISEEEENDLISFDRLNRERLTTEPEILQLLAEEVRKSKVLEDRLIEIIIQSIADDSVTTASANAIMILKQAGARLSNQNFSGARFRGADLSGAIMSNTNLSYSDLEDVNLTDAFLDHSSLYFCKAKGLELGQKPLKKIKISGHVSSIRYSSDGSQPLVITSAVISNKTTYFLTVSNFETTKKYLLKIPSVVLQNAPSAAISDISSDQKTALLAFTTAVIFYNSEKGEQIAEFRTNSEEGIVDCAAFSPDNRNVAFVTSNGYVILWDYADKKVIFKQKVEIPEDRIIRPRAAINNGRCDSPFIFFSSKGEKISFVIYGYSLLLCQINPDNKISLKKINSCENKFESIVGGAISPDGMTIIYSIRSELKSSAFLWNSESGTTRACQLPFSLGESLDPPKFSTDGRLIIGNCYDSGSRKHSVHVYDPFADKEIFKRWLDVNDLIYHLHLSFTGDGRWLNITFSSKKQNNDFELFKQSWNLDNIKIQIPNSKGKKTDHSELMISHSPDQKYVALASDDYCLIDTFTGKKMMSFQQRDMSIPVAWAFSESNKYLLIADNKEIRLWNYQANELIHCFNSDYCKFVGFSPCENWICAVTSYTFTIWNRISGELVYRGMHPLHQPSSGSYPMRMMFSPDSRRVIKKTTHNDGVHFKIYQFSPQQKSLTLEKEFKKEFDPKQVRESLYANYFFLENLNFWRIIDGIEVPYDSNINHVSFSRDKRWALKIYGNGNREVKLWNLLNPKAEQRLCFKLPEGHDTFTIALSLKARWASSITSFAVYLWDCAKGNLLLSIPQTIEVAEVEFLDDERHLLILSKEPSMQLWQVFDESGKLKPALLWSTSKPTFSLRNVDAREMRDLSEDNRQVLKQYADLDDEKSNCSIS